MGGFPEEVTPELSLKGSGVREMGVGVTARGTAFWAGGVAFTEALTQADPPAGEHDPLGWLEKPRFQREAEGCSGCSPGWSLGPILSQ